MAEKADSSSSLTEEEILATEEFRKLCGHYSRGCSLVSPCCNKEYPCRVCHNENESHQLDRFAVKEIICRKCKERQKVSKKCQKCSLTFSRYVCFFCNLYDDAEKGQYHCQKCGICRIGGRDNFFHCDTCGLCLQKSLKDAHKCVQEASHSNCPVCMEDIHSSRTAAHVPKCGHLLHNTCFQEMIRNSLYQCPQCQTSLVDMTTQWQRLDEEKDRWMIPQGLEEFKVKIKCRDCHKDGECDFHFIGLKCLNCGSYNTVRTGSEALPLEDVNPIHFLFPEYYRGHGGGHGGDEDYEEEEDEEEVEDGEDEGSDYQHSDDEEFDLNNVVEMLEHIFPNVSNALVQHLTDSGEEYDEDDDEAEIGNPNMIPLHSVPQEGGGELSLMLDPISGIINIIPHHGTQGDDEDSGEEGDILYVPPAYAAAFFDNTVPHQLAPFPPLDPELPHLESPQIWEVSSSDEPSGEGAGLEVQGGGGAGGGAKQGSGGGGGGDGDEWETASEEEIVGGNEEDLGKECHLPEEEATKQLGDVAPAH